MVPRSRVWKPSTCRTSARAQAISGITAVAAACAACPARAAHPSSGVRLPLQASPVRLRSRLICWLEGRQLSPARPAHAQRSPVAHVSHTVCAAHAARSGQWQPRVCPPSRGGAWLTALPSCSPTLSPRPQPRASSHPSLQLEKLGSSCAGALRRGCLQPGRRGGRARAIPGTARTPCSSSSPADLQTRRQVTQQHLELTATGSAPLLYIWAGKHVEGPDGAGPVCGWMVCGKPRRCEGHASALILMMKSARFHHTLPAHRPSARELFTKSCSHGKNVSFRCRIREDLDSSN